MQSAGISRDDQKVLKMTRTIFGTQSEGHYNESHTGRQNILKFNLPASKGFRPKYPELPDPIWDIWYANQKVQPNQKRNLVLFATFFNCSQQAYHTKSLSYTYRFPLPLSKDWKL